MIWRSDWKRRWKFICVINTLTFHRQKALFFSKGFQLIKSSITTALTQTMRCYTLGVLVKHSSQYLGKVSHELRMLYVSLDAKSATESEPTENFKWNTSKLSQLEREPLKISSDYRWVEILNCFNLNSSLHKSYNLFRPNLDLILPVKQVSIFVLAEFNSNRRVDVIWRIEQNTKIVQTCTKFVLHMFFVAFSFQYARLFFIQFLKMTADSSLF